MEILALTIMKHAKSHTPCSDKPEDGGDTCSGSGPFDRRGSRRPALRFYRVRRGGGGRLGCFPRSGDKYPTMSQTIDEINECVLRRWPGSPAGQNRVFEYMSTPTFNNVR